MGELNLAFDDYRAFQAMDAEKFQERILPGVSRTFALTIPQLPEKLHLVVGNAYLLCRIADTIEDDPALSQDERTEFFNLFSDVVCGDGPPHQFAEALSPLLSDRTLIAEKNLVMNTANVITMTESFSAAQRASIEHCIRSMGRGMNEFSAKANVNGLPSLREMDRYCYFVAGLVGEMLTELFCDYSDEIATNKSSLMWLGASFGQGLQMTNILKDIWEDKEHGFCWLPASIFNKHSLDIKTVWEEGYSPAFKLSLEELIGIAHSHLRNALSYTLLIPKSEQGIRRFCLWSIGLAFLTLKNLLNNPSFKHGKEIKVSRKDVRSIVLTTSVVSRFDATLNNWYKRISKDLPIIPLSSDWDPKIF